MAKGTRLDQALVQRGLFPSRHQAQTAIMAGEVRVDGQVAAKPSDCVQQQHEITVAARSRYVGRGGIKLEGAIEHFGIICDEKTALDIGASTGGFTDCLLRKGSGKFLRSTSVMASWRGKFGTISRCHLGKNECAATFTEREVPDPIEICVIDVSFISLTLILPNAFELLTPDGVILALIKPQFELAREEVGAAGIVRSSRACTRKRSRRSLPLPETIGALSGRAGSLQHRWDRRQPGILHMSPKTIGLIAHTGKPGAAELVSQLCSEFKRAGVGVRLETETAALVDLPDGQTVAQLGKEADLLVVLGGDGTILNVVARLDDTIKPIFGINIGSLGFLTCLNSSAYLEAVSSIVSGKFALSERVLLSVEIAKGTECVRETVALNDAVISRGEISRLIRLRTRVNGAPLTEFNADGLVVATPTGSTAYSLSAGGPILEPQSGVFVITPICPHVLTNRSVIVGDHSVIEVEGSEPDYPVFLTLDGRSPVPLEFGSIVTIRRSREVLPLAVLPELSFFGVVRQKLKWSGSTI